MSNSRTLLVNTENMVKNFKSIFFDFSDQFPRLNRTYSFEEKQNREAAFQNIVEEIDSHKYLDEDDSQNSTNLNKLFPVLEALCRSAVDLENNELDSDFLKRITHVAHQFNKEAKTFDANISYDDIYQAGRNVCSMNCLQHLLNLPIKLTPSIFAYSLLYPYTDNFIDDPNILLKDKDSFNHSFTQRLRGQPVEASNNFELKIFELVTMIEREYNRSQYPGVYESLDNILSAQIKSIALLHSEQMKPDMDIMEIGVEKGGASVLADGFLVAGGLSLDQQKFMFEFGAVLQLVDDLQDIHIDLNSGLLTVYSHAIQQGKLDCLTNVLFKIGNYVMKTMDCFDRDDLQKKQQFFTQIFNLLIFKAISSAQKFYSKSYLKNIEIYSPYHFSFMRTQTKKLSSFSVSKTCPTYA